MPQFQFPNSQFFFLVFVLWFLNSNNPSPFTVPSPLRSNVVSHTLDSGLEGPPERWKASLEEVQKKANIRIFRMGSSAMDAFADLRSQALSLTAQPVSNADRDSSLKDDRRRRMKVSEERWHTSVMLSHHESRKWKQKADTIPTLDF